MLRYLLTIHAFITAALAAVTFDKDVSVVIVSGQGSELDTYKYDIKDPKSISLRGSHAVKIRFTPSTIPDQASVIVSLQGDARNIVAFASRQKDGSVEGTFSWDDWENQYGPIVNSDGQEWDVSVAIGHGSPTTATLTKVATLTHLPGPVSPPLPGTVPVKTRIAEVAASLSQKPEITHQFRPEENMVAAPVSLFFTAVTMLPTVASLGLMMHVGANVKGYFMQQRVQVANLFHAGVIAIIAIHLAFWTKFNLMQILPVLIPVEVATVLAGIKLSACFTRCETKDKTA